MRIAICVLSIVVTFALTSCADPEHMTAQPNPVMQKQPEMLAQIISATGVQIMPLQGIPPEDGAKITAAVSEAFQELDIPSLAGQPLTGAHVLKGKASLDRGAFQIEWTLTDPNDVEVMAFPEREAALNPPAIKALAVRTAQAIAPLFTTPGNAGEDAVAVFVGGITGAPGDGAEALALALRRSLSGAGVTVVEALASNALQVQGQVQLSELNPSTQQVKLIWRLLDPGGGEVGVIDQSHEIRSGQLDSNWGEAAFLAADGARDGILDLLNAYREQASGQQLDQNSN